MVEIFFSYMPHAPSPAVVIQTATQVAHMGRSFCMCLRSILIGFNVYAPPTAKLRSGERRPPRQRARDIWALAGCAMPSSRNTYRLM